MLRTILGISEPISTSRLLAVEKQLMIAYGGQSRLKAIARLSLTCAEKARLIRATPLAAAKYGTPAAHVGTASACALRTAVVDAIGPETTKRCPCRTLEFNSHGDDLDPEIIIGIEKLSFSGGSWQRIPR